MPRTFKQLLPLTLTLLLTACASEEPAQRATTYGPPQYTHGFSAGGFSPAPYSTFHPTNNTQKPEADLGKFSADPLGKGWKGFTGN